MASKFFEHFVLIADAMNALTEGKQGLWDKEDGFFYDSLVAKGKTYPLKVRSLVGLTPLFATGTLPGHIMRKLKGYSIFMVSRLLGGPDHCLVDSQRERSGFCNTGEIFRGKSRCLLNSLRTTQLACLDCTCFRYQTRRG